jgi:ATP-binding cassette subfamily C protein
MAIFLSYVKELYRFAKYRVTVELVLMVALGLTEGIGVFMLIPLLNLAGIGSGAAAATGGGLAVRLERFLHQIGLNISLPVILIIYSGVIFGQSWLQRWQSVLSVAIQQSYASFLSNRLYQAVAYTNWRFLMAKAKSDITNILTTELTRVSSGTHFFLQMLATVLITTVQIGIAMLISPGLTLLVLAGGVILFSCLHSFVRKSRQMGMAISQNNRNLLFEITEHLNGIKEVKSYGLETVQIQNFARLRQTIEDNFIRFNRVQSQTDLWYKVGAAVFISLIFYCAIAIFKLPPPEFLLIIVIFARLWPRFGAFQVALQYVVMMLPAFRAVLKMEESCLAAREDPALFEADERRMNLTRGVEFRRISFTYDSTQANYAVKDVNFRLPVGSTTAFVGVSGSGKSTLVDLLIGLLTPEQGEILLDDRPLAAHSRAWRQSIGYVSQDAFLFNASIRKNLQWSTPQATETEMWEALQLASIADFIRNLPEGLDTLVGDRGVRLSGGERQRTVLARALLRKPTILILDEATSALDRENERQIQQSIEALHGRMTIVVIAHRFATIKNADQIYLLEAGRIVEQGDFHSLIADQNSRFSALAY